MALAADLVVAELGFDWRVVELIDSPTCAGGFSLLCAVVSTAVGSGLTLRPCAGRVIFSTQSRTLLAAIYRLANLVTPSRIAELG